VWKEWQFRVFYKFITTNLHPVVGLQGRVNNISKCYNKKYSDFYINFGLMEIADKIVMILMN
jgi:uncharacterized protein YllA (UPF0747 family)